MENLNRTFNCNEVTSNHKVTPVPLRKATSSRGKQRKNVYHNINNGPSMLSGPVSIKKQISSRAMTRNSKVIPIITESALPNYDTYFKSYERLSIHQEMLKDEVRTKTYRDAIYHNKHLFKDKIVLDVGCGTGILSLFAAKAGAALVIGIDNANIIDLTQEIVHQNGFEDRIVLIKARVEDVDQLPNGIEKVDVIISEWMGYCLLFESMLDTVIHARKKWLKQGGIMFPDKATLFIAGMEDRARRDSRLTWWHNVSDFDFRPIRKVVDMIAIVEEVHPSRISTTDSVVKVFDLYTINQEDLSFSAPFVLKAYQDDEMQGLVTFFEVEFTKCHKLYKFGTSMDLPPTHWKQTIFYLKTNIIMKKDEEIRGIFKLTPQGPYRRQLNICINLDFVGYSMTTNETHEFIMP